MVDGFSKSYGVTGWRLGWMHGPAALIDKITMLQQYTFVCAPHPLQWAALAALETDMTAQVDEYRGRRDLIVAGLAGRRLRSGPYRWGVLRVSQGPRGRRHRHPVCRRAIENQLLMIPGNIFSARDTHFRISYAATVATLERGLEVLRKLR